jgi:hypothetical protein
VRSYVSLAALCKITCVHHASLKAADRPITTSHVEQVLQVDAERLQSERLHDVVERISEDGALQQDSKGEQQGRIAEPPADSKSCERKSCRTNPCRVISTQASACSTQHGKVVSASRHNKTAQKPLLRNQAYSVSSAACARNCYLYMVTGSAWYALFLLRAPSMGSSQSTSDSRKPSMHTVSTTHQVAEEAEEVGALDVLQHIDHRVDDGPGSSR